MYRPDQLDGILFNFSGTPPRWDESFSNENTQKIQPGKAGDRL